MKILMILLSGFLVGTAAKAEVKANSKVTEDSQLEAKTGIPEIDDTPTEAVSVKGVIGCKSGFCPAPVEQKQASLVDQQNARNLVNWIMNNGTGTPPALDNTEGKK